MSSEISPEKNVLGTELLACSYSPLTGYFRDGWCSTHGEGGVAHLVCIVATKDFLEFSAERGKETVFAGLQKARGTMELRGGVVVQQTDTRVVVVFADGAAAAADASACRLRRSRPQMDTRNC